MSHGFKKGDRVCAPNIGETLILSSISGYRYMPMAFLRTTEGFYAGECPLAHLQLASATDFLAGDIVIHDGGEAQVDRAKNGKLWVNDSRKVHIVDKYRVRRAPIDVGNWVRVPATGLVGMVTNKDPSDVRAFQVSGKAYHERELVRTIETPMALRPSDEGEPIASDFSIFNAQKTIDMQIEVLLQRKAALTVLSAQIDSHLRPHVSSVSPWFLDGATIYINVKRDIDLNEFTKSHGQFLESASPQFSYMFRFAE